jgi:hypothetical protein
MSKKKYTCGKCESEVTDSQSFCGSCGTGLEPIEDKYYSAGESEYTDKKTYKFSIKKDGRPVYNGIAESENEIKRIIKEEFKEDPKSYKITKGAEAIDKRVGKHYNTEVSES